MLHHRPQKQPSTAPTKTRMHCWQDDGRSTKKSVQPRVRVRHPVSFPEAESGNNRATGDGLPYHRGWFSGAARAPPPAQTSCEFHARWLMYLQETTEVLQILA